MCGRYAVTRSGRELLDEFGIGSSDEEFTGWGPRYSIAPTTTAPILLDIDAMNGRQRVAGLARWDFPRSQYSDVKGPSINAKIEKLASTWKAPFASRRCAAVLSGYLEWTGPKDARQPHFLHGDGLLLAAGMWAQVEGEKRPRFVIVTREARDASGAVHDRMPAFLTGEMLERWLDPRSFTPPNRQKAVVEEHQVRKQETLDGLYASSEAIAATITEFLVDPRINNPRNVDPADPTLLAPV